MGSCNRTTLCRNDADCASVPGTTCRPPYDRVPSGECQPAPTPRIDERALFEWTFDRWLRDNGVTLPVDHWARTSCAAPIALDRPERPALACDETASHGRYRTKRLRIVVPDSGALRSVLDLTTDCWSDGPTRMATDAAASALPLAPSVMLDRSWSKDDALTLSDASHACSDARMLVAKHAASYEPGLAACLLAPCGAVGTWAWSGKAFVRR